MTVPGGGAATRVRARPLAVVAAVGSTLVLAAWTALSPAAPRSDTVQASQPADNVSKPAFRPPHVNSITHEAEPPLTRRDLFAFRTPPAPTSRAIPTPSVSSLAPVSTLPVLIGVAEQRPSGTIERTAIVTLGDQLLLVKKGDVVGGVWIVSRVDEDRIQLADRASGALAEVVLP